MYHVLFCFFANVLCFNCLPRIFVSDIILCSSVCVDERRMYNQVEIVSGKWMYMYIQCLSCLRADPQ